MPTDLPAIAPQSRPVDKTDGHDAPICLPSRTMVRPEEGLQHHPGVESVEHADAQQAPSPFPESDDYSRSIPWDTHPRRHSTVHNNRRGSLAQDPDSRRGSEGSTVQDFPPPLRRHTTTTMSVLSEHARDIISPSPPDCQELESQVTQNSVEEPKVVSSISGATSSRWNHHFNGWIQPQHKAWRNMLPLLTIIFLGILITLIILYIHVKHKSTTPPPLSITTTTQSLTPPISDSALSATTLLYFAVLDSSSPFSNPNRTTLLAYTTSNGSICIRTYSSTWLTPVQCISDLSAKTRTPLAILDWYGGPSIYYINQNNQLVGIDNVPQNNTWRPSILNTQIPPPIAHPDSQLSAVTWLNGSSAWLYYQDANLQLREYGIDDYRDSDWRTGALGPLGLALQGTGIGTSRYLLDGGEVLEVFVQTNNDAIHGRVFIAGAWEANFYAVDGTDSALGPNAALTAATVQEPGADTARILLSWVSSSGFVNVQGRDTVNVTVYNAFSAPKQLVEGDGQMQPGLAATGLGAATVYFADGEKILELDASGTDLAGGWTSVDVGSL